MIRDETGLQRQWLVVERPPAEVATVGAARVRRRGATGCKLRIQSPAGETPHALDHPQGEGSPVPVRFHAEKIPQVPETCGGLSYCFPRSFRRVVRARSSPRSHRSGTARIPGRSGACGTPCRIRGSAPNPSPLPAMAAVRSSPNDRCGFCGNPAPYFGGEASRVASTSFAICATSSCSLENARSSRSRRHSSSTSRRPYRSPSKSSRWASIRRSSPP